MTEKKDISGKAAELRSRAEGKAAQSPKNTGALSSAETQNLLHELRVHQIELEMQNDELRTSQAELEAAQTRYYDLYNLAPVGYFNVSEQGLILEANLTAAILLDTPCNLLKGRPFPQFILPENRNIYHLNHRQLLKSGEMPSFDLQMMKQDGSAFWVQLDATVAQADDGLPVIRIVISDISRRKLAAEALHEKEERYRRLVEMSPEAILVNSGTEITFANNAALHLFGASSSGELTGKSQFSLYHPDYHPLLQERIDHLIEGYSVPLVEAKALRLDGTSIDVEVVASPFTENGVRVMQVLIRDITERKKAEEILKRDKSALKILVREKTAELMENQIKLDKSKRLSDIGTLAATVAHELRNPLSGISLAVAVIKKRNADNIVERQLERINVMIAESGQIIDNLLFYSRLKPKHRKPLDVHFLLEECISTLQQVHTRKNIVISKHIDDLKNVTIFADPGQIREVFANILNNSADAVPDHGGEIDVKARIYRGLIKIHITDNGSGIAKKDLKKVFDPFFTTKPKGTGLGLTVCMQIVKMHGGFINIKNGNEKGTSIIITIPAGEPKK